MANVLITGTSTGIGQLAALQFARSGHTVYATMRDTAKAGPLREAAAAEDLAITIIQLDVDSEASVEEAVARVHAEAGGLDVLVNNAGITGVGAIEEIPESEWRAVMETNFYGPLRLIRAVVPGMRERRSGVVINISSVAGQLAAGACGPYHCSKWALECASETLAMELRPFGVRVAIVEPGFFKTPILEKAIHEWEGSEASPYANINRRVGALYQQAAAISPGAEVVAEVIERAAFDPEPKLRYPIGADAEVFLSRRPAMTDEEYLTLGDEMTDEEWFAKFMEMFPMPVPEPA